MKRFMLLMLLGCLSGFVSAQTENMTLVSQLQISNAPYVTDVWGYVSPDSTEYAIVGYGLGPNGGVAIVDLSDPANPVEVANTTELPGQDVKVYQHYVYGVDGGGFGTGGILDISDPANPQLVGTFPSSHNIFIADNGFIYAEAGSSPLAIYDLNDDPTTPVEVWSGEVEGHDATVIGDKLYHFGGWSGHTKIYNITSFNNPFSLELVSTIEDPTIFYNHQGWPTEDGNYLFITDELASHPQADISVWDISNPDNPTRVDDFADGGATVHNIFVIGDLAYVSYYEAGMRVFDVSIPEFIVETGHYDTNNQTGETTFTGAWGIYPFAPSGNLYVSDTGNGLFILTYNGANAARYEGVLTDDGSGEPIANGWLQVVENGSVVRSEEDGSYKVGYGGGGTSFTLLATAFGYAVEEQSLTIEAGEISELNISLPAAETGAISGVVTNDEDKVLDGLTVVVTIESPLLDESLEIEAVTNSSGEYTLADLPVYSSEWITYSEVRVVQSFPYASTSVYDVTVEANATSEIDFQLFPADVLLVNDDDDGAFSEEYAAIFSELEISTFDWQTVTDGSELPVADIAELNYPVIVWYSGEASGTVIDEAEADVLATLLDGGGHLIITGNNVAESLDGSDFLGSYLSVTYDGTAPSAPAIFAVEGHPVFGDLGALTVSQGSRDIIEPIGDGVAEPIFTYATGGTAGVAGSIVDTQARFVFLGFGMEAISSESNRNDVMMAAFEWLEVIFTSIEPQEGAGLPQEYALAQNFPNPFNPVTTISYSLPERTEMTLKVYNMLGQEVKTLASGVKTAGTHRVSWDGRSQAGLEVSSGIYLYRLESAAYTQTQKMILLR